MSADKHPFGEIIRALNEAGVRYVLVGGFAVALHGHPRATEDVDLVISLDPANVTAAIQTLTAIGFIARAPVDPFDLADPDKRSKWIEEKNMLAFTMFRTSSPLGAVDLMVSNTIPFEELYENSAVLSFEGVEVVTCSRKHLIQMKREAGRDIDLADISRLRDSDG